jgi:hypothetical protein
VGHRYAAAPSRRGVRSIIDATRRRLQGLHQIDPWGLDPDIAAVIDPLIAMRWRVTTSGATHVPLEGPILFVANRTFGLSEPLVLAHALNGATGRRVRFASMPDFGPFSALLRPLGGVVADEGEVRALLRNDEMVAVFAAPTPLRCRALGRIAVPMLEPALALDIPVLPVALRGHELGRRWRVAVGPSVDIGDTPASAVRAVVQAWRALNPERAPRQR